METKTVFSFVIMVGVLMAGSLLLYGENQKTYAGHRQWALGSLFLCFAFAGLMLRLIAPLWLAVGMANLFSVLYGVARFDAVMRFTKRKILSPYWYLAGIFAVSSAYYFLFVKDDISLRVFVTVTVTAGFLAAASTVILTNLPAGAKMLYACAGIALGVIPLATMAMSVQWFLNPGIGLFDGRWPRIPSFMLLAASEMLASFVFVMMQANRAAEEQKPPEPCATRIKNIIPFCMHCLNIRDEKGQWVKPDIYITKHANAEASHGLCPDCLKKYYPDFKDLP